MKRSPGQLDFFREPVYPVREQTPINIERFRANLKRAMARALRESPYERSIVAARMAQILGLPSISKATIDAYTAESKTVDISVPRFKAFVRATGANWLWDEVVKDDGLLLLEGEEAMLAEEARIRQEIKRLNSELRVMLRKPVEVKRGRPWKT
ncbi:hypothetical protein [Bartonella apis]|uniref:hypothetical protein n=1 Tax=Bartonella apis TaxID=1686310 RepID=UPI00242FF6A0|nr:hypothetical protein [Bartonella apis]